VLDCTKQRLPFGAADELREADVARLWKKGRHGVIVQPPARAGSREERSMQGKVAGRRLTRSVALVFGAAALAGLHVPSALAAPGECPTVMPVAEVTPHMHATGWTVVDGRTPQSFDVDVLGVLEDGIGPGRDMLVIDATGPVVDAGNGIWSGMSGSPIYADDGRLLGAVSYGLNDGPSGIGGATPAEEMLPVLDYGRAVHPAAPGRVQLPSTLRRRIAAATGTRTSAIGSGLRQLRVPLSFSGLPSPRLGVVERAVSHDRLAVLPYVVGTRAAGGGGGTFEPGGNFAAALSYGDVGSAGVGTTTYVCDGRALAFGHPLFWQGNVALGANTADSLAIVPGLLGAYKLANIDGDVIGTVDQDRLTAIGASIGPEPPEIPITSHVRAVRSATGETTGERDGSTRLVDASALPFYSLLHLLSNIDVTYDRVGAGTSRIVWTVTGERANGDPFSFTRHNRFTSNTDISADSLDELATDLNAIQENRFERVRMLSVHETARVEDAVRHFRVSKLLVYRRGAYVRVRGVLVVRRGRELSLRVVLTSLSTEDKAVDVQLAVPRHARSGLLSVNGGASVADGYACFFADGECGDGPRARSFDALLTQLRHAPRNDLLETELRRGRTPLIEAHDRQWIDGVVAGSRGVWVVVR
jgi:SpoIVB peptidase S55